MEVTHEQAKGKLSEAIQRNLSTAQNTMERVFSEVPEDSIVRANVLSFQHQATDLEKLEYANAPRVKLSMHAGDNRWFLHSNAFHQVCGRAGVPVQYATSLDEGVPWQRRLLEEILDTTYQHSSGRHLVRAVRGEARGFLSDKYRRLDTRPLLEMFVQECHTLGAVPYQGIATDTRVSVKALYPEIVEPVPGEYVAYGVEWSNSDFGVGKYRLSDFVLRLACINGMVAEDLLRQVHLGGRLDDRLEFSRRTYELDTATMKSATKDIVRMAISSQGREKVTARIRKAAETEANWSTLRGSLSKTLTKEELQKVEDAYTGPDVLNLPRGENTWRASQALAWIARQVEPERRIDLERKAGELLPVAMRRAA